MSRTHITPQVRSADLELSLVRDIPTADKSSRNEMVTHTSGEPITGFEDTSNPYVDYHRNDVLLSLQHMRSNGADEMTFIIETEVTELLLKAVHFELANVAHSVRNDDIRAALVRLPRVTLLIEQIRDTWRVLSTITPHGFNEFRDHLGISSGQQSYMYRHVELILGNKNAALARAHENNPDVWPALEAALNGPSLWDEVTELLMRRGHLTDSDGHDQDYAAPYQERPEVRRAWREIYQHADIDDDLYLLGEALMTVATAFTQYRWNHFVGVQRILGLKPGSGGSAGVGWLRGITEHRFFPELWTIRTDLG
ncbi:tryptophan 2,3-dioxygenase [Streptomyces rhizosphaericus]|uniref:Tryptophan 2,3-dioxygenase n=1 Tax=Streptomyces rhizosphaericus TaxID=114699 RepID=A0A6G4AV56_9ACTN|nr:tryptophan 2,3-dioxygenase family protein [Streptomyces rhizosphaericus]NEW76644.1 tryptophan 2,3-dioxygenase [Streptomyces rhizosphaericus]